MATEYTVEGQQLLRHHIRSVALKVGITKQIRWHTFRRTYSTLLRATGAELKVMQELMRHSTIRVTLDTYTQAVTTEKQAAQTVVHSLFFTRKKRKDAERINGNLRTTRGPTSNELEAHVRPHTVMPFFGAFLSVRRDGAISVSV